MADLSDAFSALSIGRKLTDEELARALRLSIADEYEAVQIYSQVAEATDNERIKAVIYDIVNEEKKHASQFWGLLAEIDPSEHEAWDKAVSENKRLEQKVIVGRS